MKEDSPFQYLDDQTSLNDRTATAELDQKARYCTVLEGFITRAAPRWVVNQADSDQNATGHQETTQQIFCGDTPVYSVKIPERNTRKFRTPTK